MQHFALTLKSAQCCTQSEDQGACCTCGCVETRPRKRAAAKIPTTPAAKPAWRRLPESASLSSTKQCSQEGAVLLRAVKASPAGAANQDDGKFNPAAPSDSEREDDSMVRASLAPARPPSLRVSQRASGVGGVEQCDRSRRQVQRFEIRTPASKRNHMKDDCSWPCPQDTLREM